MRSGEWRLARAALGWGAAALPPALLIAYILRDAPGVWSVLIAVGLALGNAVLAAAISAIAGRAGTTTAAFSALPSFAIRMMLMVGLLAALRHQPFIDAPTFALTFGLAVTLVLIAESRAWRRTPWIGLTLKEKA